MSPFRWEEIDHTLVRLKLIDLAQEMQRAIEDDEKNIWFENRGNLNSSAVPSLMLKMQLSRTEEWARKKYEIYCEVWRIQGHVKSAEFVRAVSVRAVLDTFRARTAAIEHTFSRFARRTHLPFSVSDAMLQRFRMDMTRLEGRWRMRFVIEAKECEHAERRARIERQIVSNRDVAEPEISGVIQLGPSRQPTEGTNAQAVNPLQNAVRRSKPGRRPKRPDAFVECAGTLWRKAISNKKSKVPDDQLRQIASALDAAGHLPPTVYLEGKYSRALKDFNSRNSNSKNGPILSWSVLVSRGDKDFVRGMRVLLSRCARTLDHPPLSGN